MACRESEKSWGYLADAYLIIKTHLELQLQSLLQTSKSPVAFLFLQRRQAKKLLYSLLGISCLQSLRVEVLVLNINISALL